MCKCYPRMMVLDGHSFPMGGGVGRQVEVFCSSPAVSVAEHLVLEVIYIVCKASQAKMVVALCALSSSAFCAGVCVISSFVAMLKPEAS